MAEDNFNKGCLIEKAHNAARELRDRWGLGNNPVRDFESLVSSKDFFILKFPNDKGISGVYIEKKGREKTYKCVYLNNIEPKGRVNFTLAHEIYHAYFEKSNFTACTENQVKSDPIEFTANSFAGFFLIPNETLVYCLKQLGISKFTNIKITDIFKIQRYFQVSFLSVVLAIQNLRYYSEFSYYIPRNIGIYFKYKHKKYWDELNTKSTAFGIDLNSVNSSFEIPENFRENIIKNIKNGRTSIDDISEIIDFFDIDVLEEEE